VPCEPVMCSQRERLADTSQAYLHESGCAPSDHRSHPYQRFVIRGIGADVINEKGMEPVTKLKNKAAPNWDSEMKRTLRQFL
jgi:hypothetical protein